MIRVLVVDDHPLWRDAVARDLAESSTFDVVATASDGDQAVRVSAPPPPTSSCSTSSCRPAAGVQVPARRCLRRDRRGCAGARALGQRRARGDVLEAVKSGATGYLLKSASTEELLAAVRRTAAG